MSSALRGRLAFRLVLLAAVVALVAIVMTTARASSDDETGVPPTTGSFKIIKTHPGFPQSDVVDGMFRFDIVCTDVNGREFTTGGPYIYPNDFTGAQVQDPTELPLGTDCIVTETTLAAGAAFGSWLVETDVEAGQAFIPQNPRTVTINNASGNNTIRFRNTLEEPDPIPAQFTIVKNFNPSTAADGTAFYYVVSCERGGQNLFSGVFGPLDAHGEELVISNPGPGITLEVGDQCTVEETGVGGGPLPTGWSVSPSGAVPVTPSIASDDVTVVFVNTPPPVVPDYGNIRVIKVAPPGDFEFTIHVQCQQSGGIDLSYPGDFTNGEYLITDLPAGDSCVISELFPNGDLTDFATSVNGQCGLLGRGSVAANETLTFTFVNELVDDYTGQSVCPPNQDD